ncbi:MAG: Fic family protein [Bacteroidales bacterium]|jgi:Fic family protein|nr:Fic family protein [Bacteroidales bacterium]
MDRIDDLLKEWLSLQPLRIEKQKQIDQQFMVDFNYSSNHLEGNTLTYGQTKLLLLFGRTKGSALMRDYEEMKAHNIGLELIKREAENKAQPLSDVFIQELNNTILAGDFYKISYDGQCQYKIHAGIYKTRPNTVTTPSGIVFNYASPEETPVLMSYLINWYRDEEEKGELSPIELATLFHYRYIRIYPFEDGNGRMARLLLNYILLRHGYPMIVIPATDSNIYFDILNKCDKITGLLPVDGANATKEQLKPFISYIQQLVERKLEICIQFAKGEIRFFMEACVVEENGEFQNDKEIQEKNILEDILDDDTEDVQERRQRLIVSFIKKNNKITANEIACILNVNIRTVQRDIRQLRIQEKIIRRGKGRDGYWKIIG